MDSFKLYWGLSSGSYTSSLNVGKPSVDTTGAFWYDIVVADADKIYVTVTAIDGGLESVRSNEISRAGITSGGGPTPPPPSGTASAAIIGFALWNAQTDTVIDTNFQNGEAIADNVRQCVSIEIKPNTYLTSSGAGSIKKVFDGANSGCSGVGVENSYPYAWEAGETGPQYACATSLAVAGPHTLTVTPYDGDNCTGLAGPSITLTFSVTGPASGGSQLGAPGQPYIVP